MMNFKLEANWQPTLQWIEQIKRNTGDARPLWYALMPRIRTFIQYEFSGRNPNNWQQLKPEYAKRKIAQGYPVWIGVRTGRMRRAANEDAEINFQPTLFTWKLNPTGTPTKNGDQYAQYFSWGTRKMKARPIYKSTAGRVNAFLRKDINDLNNGDRMAFTFKWLEKALRPYR